MDKFFTHRQDPLCVNAIKALTDRLAALEKVVEVQAGTIADLTAEIQARTKATNTELTEMEARCVSRIEALEEQTSTSSDYSLDEGNKGNPEVSGGITKWSERKARAIAKHADPSVWTRPRSSKPTAEPAEKKE